MTCLGFQDLFIVITRPVINTFTCPVSMQSYIPKFLKNFVKIFWEEYLWEKLFLGNHATQFYTNDRVIDYKTLWFITSIIASDAMLVDNILWHDFMIQYSMNKKSSRFRNVKHIELFIFKLYHLFKIEKMSTFNHISLCFPSRAKELF